MREATKKEQIMCRYMSVSVVAGDGSCWCGVVIDWVSGGTPTEDFELGRCDFLYSGPFWG